MTEYSPVRGSYREGMPVLTLDRDALSQIFDEAFTHSVSRGVDPRNRIDKIPMDTLRERFVDAFANGGTLKEMEDALIIEGFSTCRLIGPRPDAGRAMTCVLCPADRVCRFKYPSSRGPQSLDLCKACAADWWKKYAHTPAGEGLTIEPIEMEDALIIEGFSRFM